MLGKVRAVKLAVSSVERERRQGLNTEMWRKSLGDQTAAINANSEHKHIDNLIQTSEPITDSRAVIG